MKNLKRIGDGELGILRVIFVERRRRREGWEKEGRRREGVSGKHVFGSTKTKQTWLWVNTND